MVVFLFLTPACSAPVRVKGGVILRVSWLRACVHWGKERLPECVYM